MPETFVRYAEPESPILLEKLDNAASFSPAPSAMTVNISSFHPDSLSRLPNFRTGFIRNWEQLLLIGMITLIAGMVIYLIIPRPQAEITLKPVIAQTEVFASSSFSKSETHLPSSSAVEEVNQVENAEAASSDDEKTYKHRQSRHHSHTLKKPKHPPVTNLNTASMSQLQLLPGIGPKMAERIIEYRKRNGHFSESAQVMDVKGIGVKKFEKMKAFLKV